MHPNIVVRCLERETPGPEASRRPIWKAEGKDGKISMMVRCIKDDIARKGEGVL